MDTSKLEYARGYRAGYEDCKEIMMSWDPAPGAAESNQAPPRQLVDQVLPMEARLPRKNARRAVKKTRKPKGVMSMAQRQKISRTMRRLARERKRLQR